MAFGIALFPFCVHAYETDTSSGFFRDYSAEWDESITNTKGGGCLRVNDKQSSLGRREKRHEARANGLALIKVPEKLGKLSAASLCLELWGGHAGTANKQFNLNGRRYYDVPGYGAEDKHCAYSYPSIPLEVGDLVEGTNALLFTCDIGKTFWGHYIIYQATVRAYLQKDHPDLETLGLNGFSAKAKLKGRKDKIKGNPELSLDFPEQFSDSIASVDFYARFNGYDDNGNQVGNDWHGIWRKGNPKHQAARAEKAPFRATWDTEMIPTQETDMALRAIVSFKSGLQYRTAVLDGLRFSKRRPRVAIFACDELPKPYWSRADKVKKTTITLPDDVSKVEKAILWYGIFGGAKGEDPFTINGKSFPLQEIPKGDYRFCMKKDLSLDHLKAGTNELVLDVASHHHGIEMLLPGPHIVLRYRK